MSDYFEYLLTKYGPRLTTADLADVLKRKSSDAIRNEIAEGTFPIPVYRDNEIEGSRAPWYADARDVAEYLDNKRPKVVKPASRGQDAYNA